MVNILSYSLDAGVIYPHHFFLNNGILLFDRIAIDTDVLMSETLNLWAGIQR